MADDLCSGAVWRSDSCGGASTAARHKRSIKSAAAVLLGRTLIARRKSMIWNCCSCVPHLGTNSAKGSPKWPSFRARSCTSREMRDCSIESTVTLHSPGRSPASAAGHFLDLVLATVSSRRSLRLVNPSCLRSLSDVQNSPLGIVDRPLLRMMGTAYAGRFESDFSDDNAAPLLTWLSEVPGSDDDAGQSAATVASSRCASYVNESMTRAS